MNTKNMVTIREAVQRCEAEGLRVSEYALRRWIKSGEIPYRMAGVKVLIFYPNLIHYLQGDVEAKL